METYNLYVVTYTSEGKTIVCSSFYAKNLEQARWIVDRHKKNVFQSYKNVEAKIKLIRKKRPQKDHIGYKGYWILVEKNQVVLNKQKVNEPRTEKITMPKSVFNRFIKFYQTGE